MYYSAINYNIFDIYTGYDDKLIDNFLIVTGTNTRIELKCEAQRFYTHIYPVYYLKIFVKRLTRLRTAGQMADRLFFKGGPD